MKWDKDKTDGPMHAQLVKKLVTGTVITKKCFVRGEDEIQWTDYVSHTIL